MARTVEAAGTVRWSFFPGDLRSPAFLGILLCALVASPRSVGQSGQTAQRNNLQFDLGPDSTTYFQVSFLNQVWLRYDQSDPGTTVQGVDVEHTFDIGLRRTRVQMFGALSERVFLYLQFGQNNFNAQTNVNGNRKLNAFFHDALCEYKVSRDNGLKLGAGLSIANGPSRFSQPSAGTIMTMDLPVFAQTTVDQTDEFSRKLSVHARGQVGHVDYRVVLSDPFPITSSGSPPPPISAQSSFAAIGGELQQQAYIIWQFLDHEPHTTPYMTGTYLGERRVLNVAVGGVHQGRAMWRTDASGDTLYQDMTHLCIESYLDVPLDRTKGNAVSACASYFLTDYGTDYLRYNGLMNPASGSSLDPATAITGQGPNYGNAYPMFGTGSVVHVQAGYLFRAPRKPNGPRFMPYISATMAGFDRLQGAPMNVFTCGVNCLLDGHRSKLTLDLQDRPTYFLEQGRVVEGVRRRSITLQYQIYL